MMYGPAKRKSPHKSGSYGRTSFAIWGSGKAKGEFLCVDYMAVASAHVMNLDKLTYDQQGLSMLGHSKVGCGQEITIRELLEAIGNVIGYTGAITFNPGKPDAPRVS